jgi:hypothetical protein
MHRCPALSAPYILTHSRLHHRAGVPQTFAIIAMPNIIAGTQSLSMNEIHDGMTRPFTETDVLPQKA